MVFGWFLLFWRFFGGSLATIVAQWDEEERGFAKAKTRIEADSLLMVNFSLGLDLPLGSCEN